MTSNRSPRRIDRTAGGRNKKAKPLTVKQIEKSWNNNYVSKRSQKN